MAQPAPVDGWLFRPDIEGLRAIAIVGVILFHAGIRTVSGGFLGVDVFFVLSGFLITGILIEEVRQTGTVSLPAFWARRARRLLPAATLVSLVTLALVAGLDSPFAPQTYARSAIAFATYWSNLLFIRRGADYFNHSQASDPFLHTWSLAIEEQYYLVFAPLVLLLAWMVRAKGFGYFRNRLLGVAIVVTAASFAGCLILTAARPIISFYGLPSRAWEFGVGAFLAVAASHGARRGTRWDPLLAIVALGALIASWFLADGQTPHPGAITILPVLGTGALIHLGGGSPSLVGRLLEARPMRVLGRLSYSWYLWHWPITVYWAKLLPGNTIPMVIGMPIVSLALAQLTYMVIESRARRSPIFQTPRFALLAAAVMAAVTVGAAKATTYRANGILRAPAYASILEARDTRARIYRDGCHLDINGVNPKICDYGLATSDTTVALFGDSHAVQWFPALEAIAIARGWHLISLTKSGCPSVSITVWTDALGRAYTECDRWRTAALDSIAVLRPDLVVLGNFHWHKVMDERKWTGPGWSSPPPRLWTRGLQATLDRLPRTAGIVFLEDTPNPHFDVPTCLIEQMPHTDRCTFPRNSAIAFALLRVEREAARANPRLILGDPADLICGRAVCSTFRNGESMFSDINHLSVRFSASLSGWLSPILDSSLASRHAEPVRPSP
jgi:peptidoglycan/LPS O-acetylase OafA/YrhL